MGADTFQDLGEITLSYLSVVDSHFDIECINIEIPGSLEYQLYLEAFVVEKMVRDKQDTMFSQGWKLDCASQQITREELLDSISYCVKEVNKKKRKRPIKTQFKKKQEPIQVLWM